MALGQESEAARCAGPDGLVTARAGSGEEATLLAEIDGRRAEQSHARKLFLRDRRPELYSEWIADERDAG